eukprot:scaffold900_cov430-Prasinococcus_capsulatus_cf.AAC.13
MPIPTTKLTRPCFTIISPLPTALRGSIRIVSDTNITVQLKLPAIELHDWDPSLRNEIYVARLRSQCSRKRAYRHSLMLGTNGQARGQATNGYLARPASASCSAGLPIHVARGYEKVRDIRSEGVDVYGPNVLATVLRPCLKDAPIDVPRLQMTWPGCTVMDRPRTSPSTSQTMPYLLNDSVDEADELDPLVIILCSWLKGVDHVHEHVVEYPQRTARSRSGPVRHRVAPKLLLAVFQRPFFEVSRSPNRPFIRLRKPSQLRATGLVRAGPTVLLLLDKVRHHALYGELRPFVRQGSLEVALGFSLRIPHLHVALPPTPHQPRRRLRLQARRRS